MTTFLITGANRGIGLELTRQAAARGDRVLACCRSPQSALELQALETETPSLRVLPLDVTSDGSVRSLVRQLEGETLDVVINNAGFMSEHQSRDDMDYDAWTKSFEVNTISPFRVSTALLPFLKQSAQPKVITITSQMGMLSRESTGAYAYRSSKAAANKVTQVMALELKPDGIIVCPVHPGWVRTDMGGPSASIRVEESARGILALIDGLTLEQSGQFFQYDGQKLAW